MLTMKLSDKITNKLYGYRKMTSEVKTDCKRHRFMSHEEECPYCREEATEAAIEALTPSAETKAAYSGEFFEPMEMPNPEYCGCGGCDACEMFPDTQETHTVDVPVSWDTIKKIMAKIRERAGM